MFGNSSRYNGNHGWVYWYWNSIENRVNAAQSDEDLKEINDELGERWGIVSLYDKETVTEIENVDNIKYKYFPL